MSHAPGGPVPSVEDRQDGTDVAVDGSTDFAGDLSSGDHGCCGRKPSEPLPSANGSSESKCAPLSDLASSASTLLQGKDSRVATPTKQGRRILRELNAVPEAFRLNSPYSGGQGGEVVPAATDCIACGNEISLATVPKEHFGTAYLEKPDYLDEEPDADELAEMAAAFDAEYAQQPLSSLSLPPEAKLPKRISTYGLLDSGAQPLPPTEDCGPHSEGLEEEGLRLKRRRVLKDERPGDEADVARNPTFFAMFDRPTSCALPSSESMLLGGDEGGRLAQSILEEGSSARVAFSQRVPTVDNVAIGLLIEISPAPRGTTCTKPPSSDIDQSIKISNQTGAGGASSAQCGTSTQCMSHGHDYTELPGSGAFITGTSSTCGLRLYFPKRPNRKAMVVEGAKKLRKGPSLLEKPIYRILDEIDEERNAGIRGYFQAEMERTMLVDSSVSGNNLWVEKYAPRQFMDLIGDERVNRQTLRWVKQWDQCVFGGESAKAKEARKVRQLKEDVFSNGKKLQKAQQDPYGRPDRKILLLSGPPGYGKTTLAHVIAETAGYNVVEINASDERTGPAVRNKIIDATQMQSVMGNRRPNLVIIDEIDGAAAGGEANLIRLLVDMASAEPDAARTKRYTAQVSRKQTPVKPLLRPIICICNDQYATCLKPLRQIAQIYTVSASMPSALAKRLLFICEAERLAADIRLLRTLCARTSGDVRNCLNILQFVKAKSARAGDKGAIRPAVIEAASVAMAKDAKESLRSLWKIIFEIWSSKKRGMVGAENRADDRRTYLPILIPMIENSDEVDKVMKGCFENYTQVKYHDDLFYSKMDAVGDWVFLYDTLRRRIQANFTFELSPYLAYSVAVFHEFFAGSANQTIEYPSADYETHLLTKRNESIFTSLLSNLPPPSKRSFPNVSIAAVELISPLLSILNPNLRKVNVQLIKPGERDVLARVVKLLISFNITFVQEKNEEGAFVYRVEPSFDELVNFSVTRQAERFCGRYALRQLVAQEMEREIIRQAEEAKERRVGKTHRPLPEVKATDNAKGNKKRDATKEKCATDFFGRPILAAEGPDDSSSSKQTSQAATKVLFRFNEGFSNAVRKSLRISDLLPGGT